jgi:small subunit ribosomal protein S8
MTNDLTSDMLTRIRNAILVKQTFVNVLYCKLNIEILKVLKSEGYIEKFEIFLNLKNKKQIKIYLKYKGWWIKKALFSKIVRVSKPGQRMFASYQDFSKKVNLLKSSQGTAIISTSSGIMSHKKAIKLKKGGEIICYIG